MIYLITGVPGSGKSLYAVAELLPKLAKEVVKHADGTEVRRRLVVDGIPDLKLDHAMMAPSEIEDKGRITCEGHGMANWHEWCQPGDVLVVDEVQRYLRPRALGVTPPPCIKELETHRHKGVDFVFITQRPGLIDQNIRQLVGRHQHVRRIFGFNRAIIYDWDGCQADTHRVAGASKSVWSYPRRAFADYKSAELHTKQRQKIPGWLIVPVIATAAGFYFAPSAYRAITGKPEQQAAKPAQSPHAGTAPVKQASTTPGPAAAPATAPAAPQPTTAPAPVPVAFRLPMPDQEPERELQGCIHMRDRCECFDARLVRVSMPVKFCEVSAHRVGQIASRDGGGGAVPTGPLGGLASTAANAMRPVPAPAPAGAIPAQPAVQSLPQQAAAAAPDSGDGWGSSGFPEVQPQRFQRPQYSTLADVSARWR